MGQDASNWTKPVQTVTVESFNMGTYEVTQDIYEEVIGSNPSDGKGARLPVEQLSWYDAIAFANALRRQDGLEEVYTINGQHVTCDWTKQGKGHRRFKDAGGAVRRYISCVSLSEDVCPEQDDQRDTVMCEWGIHGSIDRKKA